MGELENGGGLKCGITGGGWMWEGGALSVSPPVGTSGLLAFAALLHAQLSTLWTKEVLCKHPRTPKR